MPNFQEVNHVAILVVKLLDGIQTSKNKTKWQCLALDSIIQEMEEVLIHGLKEVIICYLQSTDVL